MSNKQHKDAILEGYNGPFFPKIINNLLKAQDKYNIRNGDLLERSGMRVWGYEKIFRTNTSDGYCWFWGLHFLRPFGQIIILFPWAQDWNAEDGNQNDRSVAIYTKGLVNVSYVIRKLMKSMMWVNKNRLG